MSWNEITVAFCKFNYFLWICSFLLDRCCSVHRSPWRTGLCVLFVGSSGPKLSRNVRLQMGMQENLEMLKKKKEVLDFLSSLNYVPHFPNKELYEFLSLIDEVKELPPTGCLSTSWSPNITTFICANVMLVFANAEGRCLTWYEVG